MALRNNSKQVDLSRTIRLSGLSSGAKLELILLSRSPSVVSVALQVPDSEAQDAPNNRLIDQFPSTTTLWLILRKFESEALGGARSLRNFTGRGIPKAGNGGTGAGRLYYETPVVQVMGRELSSFTDLQKTLGQLGFNAGSALLRLSFRFTDTPFEEATKEIGQYFNSVGGESGRSTHTSSVANTESDPEVPQPAVPEEFQDQLMPLESSKPLSELSELLPEPVSPANDAKRKAGFEQTTSSLPESSTVTGPNQRPISIFSPPSSTTPKAALRSYNEADYEPSIEHAKMHQSRLLSSTRNRRLPTDVEIAVEKTEKAKKMAEINEVEIKVRFPDQTQVVSKFSNLDTAITLYDFVRGMMERETEPFLLSYASADGPKNVPPDSADRLITGLNMTGRVLVNFVWEEGASNEARLAAVVKTAFREQAKEIEVKEVESVDVQEEEKDTSDNGMVKGKERGKGGVPKWFKLGGKKKH